MEGIDDNLFWWGPWMYLYRVTGACAFKWLEAIRPESTLNEVGDSTSKTTVRRRSFNGGRSPALPIPSPLKSLCHDPHQIDLVNFFSKIKRKNSRSWSSLVGWFYIMANSTCWFKCSVFFCLLVSALISVSVSGNFPFISSTFPFTALNH